MTSLHHLSLRPLPARNVAPLLLALCGVTAACGDADPATAPDAGGPDAELPDAATDAALPDDDCDPLDPSACALPWPSGRYLEPADTATGVRLAFAPRALPANLRRRPIDPVHFEGLDGYGLGTPILFDLGELDFSRLPDEWTGLEASLAPSSPTLLFEDTPEGLVRVPHFVEPDANVEEGRRITYLRPAVILRPATRYVVALRGLVRPDGDPVEPSPAFAALRDGSESALPDVARRRPSFEALFGRLEAAGVAREELVLAWDFVTASEGALHHRLDRMIALAFDEAPEGGVLEVEDVETFARSAEEADGGPVDANIRYTIRARMRGPGFLVRRERDAGWRLALDDAREVVRAEDFETRVLIQVPHRALEGEPEGVIVYGHGLFGNENEIRAGHLKFLAQEHGYVVMSLPLVGMSSDDFDHVVGITSDLNAFEVIADGLHQGLLNHHLLARAARTTLAAFLASVDEDIAIDPEDVTFFGASQGGIFGQTILATSPDIQRAALGVPGSNYVTMLERSINFSQFAQLLSFAYSDAVDRAVAITAVQLLWDRTDPVSYVGRMLEGDRRALFMVSKGDYQVAVVTNEIAARTFPALGVLEGYDAARQPMGLTVVPYPHEGTGLVLFDFGNPWPTDRGNRPPRDGLSDPHSRISEVEGAGEMLVTFLREGRIVDSCGPICGR